MDAWALYASGESSEPSQADHVTYIHHQPQEPGSLLPGRNPRKPALTFGQLREIRWITPSMSLTFNQVYILKCSNYLPEWHSAFEISSYLWQMDLGHGQPCTDFCWGEIPRAPSMLRGSRGCSGCSQADPKWTLDAVPLNITKLGITPLNTASIFQRWRFLQQGLGKLPTPDPNQHNPQIQPKPD